MKEKKRADGWISIDRNIREHWIYSEKPFSRFKAWIDLILSANFRDKAIMVNGKPFLVRRGTFLTSVRKLSERWGWSKNKTSRFLSILRDDGMIKTGTPNGTLITIVNYGFYQDMRDTKRDTKGTRTGQRRDTEGIQENNVITMDNKENNIESSPGAENDDDDGMSMEEYDRMREAEKNGTV